MSAKSDLRELRSELETWLDAERLVDLLTMDDGPAYLDAVRDADHYLARVCEALPHVDADADLRAAALTVVALWHDDMDALPGGDDDPVPDFGAAMRRLAALADDEQLGDVPVGYPGARRIYSSSDV